MKEKLEKREMHLGKNVKEICDMHLGKNVKEKPDIYLKISNKVKRKKSLNGFIRV